ncbi:MAG: hypothetical protein UX09_C0040G0010 [Candidatus Uhrbacteria bacterium GW2011_GWE2_45_35]|uniref:CxxC-x17-CxxC domain-containing protein n=2 Tax=Candidatus Uhriibacteriota TaxID=1752732 RepID=A0A0G1MDQ1_9BACT|nr:MAG: hypothetical protein UW63_C0037G0004 [Candidatus Uhrbacteria bacterium GW2011_GWF2_44_350]KKU06858.1 MAG: hypothetical protein UX09_C0040G0010 [Candidatus Uhrbacteria bacterium GW2011_GWE2_45_35]HBR80767.1 hypothetical protein [Candidatus Uhrbacteria bacterium]HCU31779.1 hypothetical protein [Candidatus Uhrbacteria bacterium]
MGNFNRGGRSGGGGFKRDFGGGGGGGRFGGGGRPPMFRATCSECGESCELPFRPSGERPVFCSNCFAKQNDDGGRPSNFGGDRHERPRFEDRQMHDATCTKCGADCQVPFRPTGDKEIFCNDCFSEVKRDRPAPSRGGRDSGDMANEIKMLNEKMDKLIKLLSPAGAEEKVKAPKVEKEVKAEEVKVEAPKKAEKVKKEKVVKAKVEPKVKAAPKKAAAKKTK